MIKPKPKPSPLGSRAAATLMTVALLLGMWVGLQELAVPAFASGRDVIRELDPLLFERYATPPPPDEAVTPEEIEAPEPEPPAEVTSFEQEVGAAMDELERLFASEDPTAPVSERAGEGDVSTPGIAEDVPDDRFEALFGGGTELGVPGAAARRPGRGVSQGESVGLGISERAGTVADTTPSDAGALDVPAGIEAVTATRREATTESEVVIGDFDAESFDGSAADRLATWMRANAAPLPVGVRAHVNFQPTFLTSAVPITADGRAWDLYLMFNESLRELHIVLVEGDRSIYMIDRGFQEESRSLREGTVRRLDGRIVAVDSRTASASSERAQDFYNVFLSWWESVNDDAGSS